MNERTGEYVERNPQLNALQKQLYILLGLMFVGIGAVGAVLPVLPTTPFMILALLCFSKSSQRLHGWLYNHRVFGPSLHRWNEHRVIPPVAKMCSISAMSLSFAYALMFTQSPWYVLAAMAAVMLFGAWYVLTKPSYVPSES